MIFSLFAPTYKLLLRFDDALSCKGIFVVYWLEAPGSIMGNLGMQGP